MHRSSQQPPAVPQICTRQHVVPRHRSHPMHHRIVAHLRRRIRLHRPQLPFGKTARVVRPIRAKQGPRFKMAPRHIADDPILQAIRRITSRHHGSLHQLRLTRRQPTPLGPLTLRIQRLRYPDKLQITLNLVPRRIGCQHPVIVLRPVLHHLQRLAPARRPTQKIHPLRRAPIPHLHQRHRHIMRLLQRVLRKVPPLLHIQRKLRMNRVQRIRQQQIMMVMPRITSKRRIPLLQRSRPTPQRRYRIPPPIRLLQVPIERSTTKLHRLPIPGRWQIQSKPNRLRSSIHRPNFTRDPAIPPTNPTHAPGRLHHRTRSRQSNLRRPNPRPHHSAATFRRKKHRPRQHHKTSHTHPTQQHLQNPQPSHHSHSRPHP